MKKRSLALFLALVMCLGLLPTVALAGGYDPSWDVAYPVPGGELHFDTKRGYITGCTPGVTVADIPDAINGVEVKEIYNYAFNGCTELTRINIPASVTKVWDSAFQESDSKPPKALTEINVAQNNANYASVDGVLFNKAITTLVRFPLNKQSYTYNIPNSVTKINGSAFSNCTAIKNVVMPDSVTTIDDWAFSGSGITSVVIGSDITSIGDSVFTSCWRLTSVTIPSSVTSIGYHAFWNCIELKDIYFTGNEAQWNSIKFDKYDEDTLQILASATIHYNSTGPDQPTNPIYNPNDFTIEKGVLTKYTGLGGDVTIPNSVTMIGDGAFGACTGLTSVTIPNSVTEIESSAFIGCASLKDIYYSDSDTRWSKIKGDELKLSECTIHYNSTGPDHPTTPTQPTTPDQPSTLPAVEPIPATGTAVPATQTVLLDGKKVEFQCYALLDAKGNLSNYVKIRDLALALNGTKAQFNVGWDGSKIVIETGKAYQANGSENKTTYAGDQKYKSVSGNALSFNEQSINLTSINIQNGNTYYKLRDLGQLMNFNVMWNGSSVVVETDKPYTG